MYRSLRVGVVIPAYNEARAIGRTIADVPALVDDILVVDDASHDATLPLAQAAAQARPGTTVVIQHAANRGVGAAISTGYRHALDRGCDVIAVMAGDGQMDPEDLPRLIDPIAEDRADYVKGNRFLHPEIWTAMPPSRIVGNLALSAATRITSGYRHIFDSQCGYTAMHRRVLAEIDLDALFPRYGYPNDLLSRLAIAGARVVDVPVRPIYGPHWKSGINLRTAVHPIPWVLLRSWSTRLAARLRRE
ncbi:MAG: glycosyltransferase family 2 protein [Myxococcales bacterium]|nr:glycosyltransferase family 2 protein [Myxococcales bacterium]HRC58572.1 glycosyltransferase family 2 protein [Kofleriaceae bacterium]